MTGEDRLNGVLLAYVEALEAGRDPRQAPVMPPEPRSAGGRLGLLILMAVVAIAAIAYWFL